jgi:hypothetical protein
MRDIFFAHSTVALLFCLYTKQLTHFYPVKDSCEALAVNSSVEKNRNDTPETLFVFRFN